MAQKKNYNRYFIIFQEEDKGYGIAIDKQPTGYTKIETKNGKCKITVYVQNLLGEKGPYTCCLIDASKNPVMVARLGQVALDSTGRGETWWEFNEDNIAETGLSADRFSISAVLANSEAVRSPLAGYIGKDRIDWKDKINLNTRTLTDEIEDSDQYDDKYEVQTSAIPMEDEVEVFGLQNDEVINSEEEEFNRNIEEENEEIDEEGDKFIEYEREIQKQIDNWDEFREDISSLEEYFGNDNIDTQDDMDDDFELDLSRKKHSKRTYSNIFHDILKELNESEEIKMDRARWWKVPLDFNPKMKDNKYYPYYCSVYHLKMTYPYINYMKYIKPCGHYYFGIRYDNKGEVKYIMYGIPGRKAPKDQPYGGMTGFMRWMKLDGDRGIWIMYYNPYTGCIMIPKGCNKRADDR